MQKLVFSAVLLSALIFGCKAKKNPNSETVVSNEPVILLDTLEVKPAKAPEEKVYRYSNTRETDILHTKLEVRFDWQNSWLFGKATIEAKPYFYTTNKLHLNARGMELYKVQLVMDNNYIDLKYTYENDSITITLDKPYARFEKYTVFIEYKSKPNDLKAGGSRAINSDKGLYFINPKGEDPNKMPQIWTQGETQSNSVWFPTVDSPNERMTEEIYMTVDNKYTTLSNGSLVAQTKNSDGTRTDHWKMDLPHAPYLVMMGVGEFKKVTDKPWNGKEVSYYVEKEFEPHAKAIFGNTPEMIEFFSTKLGVPYAWPKYAQIVARDYVSGAMENTSATLHGDFVYQTDKEIIDGSRGEDVISHELFHQWFGDLVTCESWSNLPLNESFATYGEYLWEEYKYGRDAADDHSYDSRMGYFAEATQSQKDMIRFDVVNREDMFDGHSYNKGGQILHMLRKYVGEDAFFASLKLYLEKNKFTSVEIHNLRLAFEEVTGEDMNWFFNQWFLAKGHPDLNIKSTYDESAKKLKLTVKQQQDFSTTPVYKLPLCVDFYFGEGASKKVRREKITINKSSQEFSFDMDSKPNLVNFDAEKQLLCKRTENKTLDDYIYQYKNAPLFMDRLEALQAFKGNLAEPGVYDAVKLALNDKWNGHRSMAINLLEEFAVQKEAELKPILMGLAANDEKSSVRAEALDFLVKFYSGDDLNKLYKARLEDKSSLVVGSALSAIAKSDPAAALAKAKAMENEKSDNMRYAIMDLYANYGDDANNEYFMKQKTNFAGFESFGFLNLYSSFLKRCSDETVISGANVFRDFAKNDANAYVKFFAQKAIKGQVNRYQDKEDELSMKLEEIKKGSGDPIPTQQLMDKVQTTKTKLQEIYDSSK
ncbi:MAG: aminopeptidase 1-like [Bacteroidetes bacterium]|jgi:aminopeptidase N|nr:aminopeptidase 1-like [Bacteroidota bacterium]